jgi:hypothetical protein
VASHRASCRLVAAASPPHERSRPSRLRVPATPLAYSRLSQGSPANPTCQRAPAGLSVRLPASSACSQVRPPGWVRDLPAGPEFLSVRLARGWLACGSSCARAWLAHTSGLLRVRHAYLRARLICRSGCPSVRLAFRAWLARGSLAYPPGLARDQAASGSICPWTGLAHRPGLPPDGLPWFGLSVDRACLKTVACPWTGLPRVRFVGGPSLPVGRACLWTRLPRVRFVRGPSLPVGRACPRTRDYAGQACP